MRCRRLRQHGPHAGARPGYATARSATNTERPDDALSEDLQRAGRFEQRPVQREQRPTAGRPMLRRAGPGARSASVPTASRLRVTRHERLGHCDTGGLSRRLLPPHDERYSRFPRLSAIVILDLLLWSDDKSKITTLRAPGRAPSTAAEALTDRPGVLAVQQRVEFGRIGRVLGRRVAELGRHQTVVRGPGDVAEDPHRRVPNVIR